MSRKKLLVLAIFYINVFCAFAQENNEIYTTYYNKIEPVSIQLSKTPHGNIQWQESIDNGLSWQDIPGANEALIEYSTEISSKLRSVILSGSCDTVLSHTLELKALRVETDYIDSITDISAKIHCRLEEGAAVFSEYGILYGTSETIDINQTKIQASLPIVENIGIKINNLRDELTYYVRSYAICEDETVIYGNLLSFQPIKVSLENRINISTDTVQVKYTISGLHEEDIDEHGILINSIPDDQSSAMIIEGSYNNGNLHAIARELSSGSDYYVTAFIRSGENYYYSSEKKITTWSDYNDPVDNSPFTISHKIVWDNPSEARKISQDGTYGDYGRIERVGNSDTLLFSYHGGPNSLDWVNIYLRKSSDNGATWGAQEKIMDPNDYPGEYWRFCNPELLYMQNGWIMLAYEANTRGDENNSSVQILISKDTAKTWEEPIKYHTGRSWEPAMLELPNGEVELFYSCEAPWWPGDPVYQDIRVIRSTDHGISWSDPQVVAYYPEKRDGMPVPSLLQGNKGAVFAIECVNIGDSPFIIHRDMDSDWELTTSDFYNSPHRWLIDGFSGHGGAPYLLQLPTGETVLSAHIYRGGDWHQNNYQQVQIGDNNAKNFQNPTMPWDNLLSGEGAVNNSLFMKNDTTIVTISTRMFTDGSSGIYWLEGKIETK